jgi:DNA mismatch repair protein MutL
VAAQFVFLHQYFLFMPDKINLLPDNIANQIAAGEVIQRPASAVKELMENSIDAGATQIKLIIKDAGKQLIQVIDNGCGMSETDARMCFERHATSKIKSIEDLFKITTMGFRGEAMASIAAVAQVELKTKREDDETGVYILNEGCEVKIQEPCQTPTGTSIAIKNLFFNVPARRNFLKSNTTELKNIIDEFQRIALAHPEINFGLNNNGAELFNLQAGNLKQRVVALFGNNYKEKLVTVYEETSVCNISGFVGTPDSAKKSRGEQFFFVNKRFIKSNYLNHAVNVTYSQLMQQDSFPLYVLFIDVDPSRIDINVHPTKQEIKFDDEKIVYSFLNSAVKKALAQFSITPSLDFTQDTAFTRLEGYNRSAYKTNDNTVVSFDTNSHSFKPIIPIEEQQRSTDNLNNWESLYQNLKQPNNDTESSEQTFVSKFSTSNTNGSAQLELTDTPQFVEQLMIQLHHRYILTPIKSGFMLIDQQAAHERILYEKFQSYINQQQKATQHQLFPVKIELGRQDAILLKEILADINLLGFDIQEFGADAFIVHGVPAEMKNNWNEKQAVQYLLNQLKENLELKLNQRESIAKAMARQSSIKWGTALTNKEMKLIVDELFACEKPYASPGGKLTFTIQKLDEIEKLFEK